MARQGEFLKDLSHGSTTRDQPPSGGLDLDRLLLPVCPAMEGGQEFR
jgi:hypothetical protein